MAILKKRHGCLTTYLIFLLILFLSSFLAIPFISEDRILKEFPKEPPHWIIPIIFVHQLFGLICLVAIFLRKKWGFWGCCLFYIISFFLNLQFSAKLVAGFNLLAVITLYGVLQIGKDNKGWDQLK